MAKRALVTGVTGQDGAYLAKLLLDNGYEVFGAYRRNASGSEWRLAEVGAADAVTLVPFDLLEFTNIRRTLDKVQPDEIYNLAAQSFVGMSFEQPIYTGDVDALGAVRILEAIRDVNPKMRFYQASTSEMFGKVQETPQTEQTPFYPRSPYGAAKLYAHWMTVNYREAYGLFSCSGILFNHESPLRGTQFVTRKITAGMAKLKMGGTKALDMGNLDAHRDWGFAGDYVRGMYLMMQQEQPGDYVLATGETHSVREFVNECANAMDIQLEWKGKAESETAIDVASGKVIITINPEHYRPAEVDLLIGDSSRARTNLGWLPEVDFKQLVSLMAHADLDRLSRGVPLV